MSETRTFRITLSTPQSEPIYNLQVGCLELQKMDADMLAAIKTEMARFITDERGVLEGDWGIILVSLGAGLGLSSYFGWNIGLILSEAFDDLIGGALRRAGV